MSDERYLTFALGKGRLAKQTLKTFEKIGITCEEMKDPATRKLIFVNEEMKMRFFLAKGPDVPTYAVSTEPLTSVLWERIRSWRRPGTSMRCWIWDSGNAECVSAGPRNPGNFCSITN